MLSFGRAVAATTVSLCLGGLLTGCLPNLTLAAAATPDDLDAATRATYAARISSAFGRRLFLPVRFRLAALRDHPRDAAVLSRLGYVERTNGAYRWTPAGMRASSGTCEKSAARNSMSCLAFPVGRPELVAVKYLRFPERDPRESIDSVLARVGVRTVATTPLGRALAASSDLVCETIDGVVPWKGASTVAEGKVVLPLAKPLEMPTITAAADAVAVEGKNGRPAPYVLTTCPELPSEFATIYSDD